MDEKTLNEARDIIAAFLKQHRLELGLTQQEVADRAGVARKTINAMEAGLFWLGMKQYLQVCEALQLLPVAVEMKPGEDIAAALRNSWKVKAK